MSKVISVAVCDDDETMLPIIAGVVQATFPAEGATVETFSSAKQFRLQNTRKQTVNTTFVINPLIIVIRLSTIFYAIKIIYLVDFFDFNKIFIK